MKIAIVGSRNIDSVNMKEYLVKCDEIISGGAKGIDSLAAKYANENNIKLTEFLPEYNIYGKAAPIIRNKKIRQRVHRHTMQIIIYFHQKPRRKKQISLALSAVYMLQ